jgi:hypothetical protein
MAGDKDEEILGTTKISNRWRISLIQSVREQLGDEEDEPDIGDRVVFRRRGDDVIVELA